MKTIGVVDFDGTLTNAEEEAKPFLAAYQKDLMDLTALPRMDIEAFMATHLSRIMANPQAYGWEVDGRIVAPAAADPYIRMDTIAGAVLKAETSLDADMQFRILRMLFRKNYEKTDTVFRPHAEDVMSGFTERQNCVYIVTGSDPEKVRAKLHHLGDGLLATMAVVGFARKYVVNDHFALVPRAMQIPGLSRPVHLRRWEYYLALDRLREEHGARWGDIAVVGDIFELDLALPLALGCRVALLANEYTPEYEKDFLASHQRGRVLTEITEIPPFFLG